MKRYISDSVAVEFQTLPGLEPQILNTHDLGFLGALRGASAQRQFTLLQDWAVTVTISTAVLQESDLHPPADSDPDAAQERPDTRFEAPPPLDRQEQQETLWKQRYADLGGQIIIPRRSHPEDPERPTLTLLDGASVPLPWLVSFLSFGVLRPIGVMLTASIVHDYAFMRGGLWYRDDEDGTIVFRAVRRDLADQLFYDINRVVNDMPITATVAWLAVRLGWFFVDYNGQKRGGEFPWIAVNALIIILLLLTTALSFFGLRNVVTAIALIYVLIFVLLRLTAPRSARRVTDPR